MIYYPAAIFQDAHDAGYGVIIPDLPGCYPLGDTIEEAMLTPMRLRRSISRG